MKHVRYVSGKNDGVQYSGDTMQYSDGEVYSTVTQYSKYKEALLTHYDS